MYDITKINIWKEQPEKPIQLTEAQNDISDLELSPRSFNCLKRAGLHTVGDVLTYLEIHNSFLGIRNLGKTSETEILAKLENWKKTAAAGSVGAGGNSGGFVKKTIIKPAKRNWDRSIDEFPISNFSRKRLKNCGIRYIKDLYIGEMKEEPGWYAVRELFEKIPMEG